MAEQICIRLNALAEGKDLEIIDLLTEIRSGLKKQATEQVTQIPSLPPPEVSRKELHECHFSKIFFTKTVTDSDDWAYTLEHIQKIGGSVESRVFELPLFWLSPLTGKRITLEEDIKELEDTKLKARSTLELQVRGDLIILIQHNRITHVVEVLDDEIRETEAGYFRWVRVVWMPKGDWSRLPAQERLLGFPSSGLVSLANKTPISLSNSKLIDFSYTCWYSFEAFQKHIFELLPVVESLDIKSSNTDGDNLSSERFGVDYYAKLRDFLVAKDWKAANRETYLRMQQLATFRSHSVSWLEYIGEYSESDFEKSPVLI
ncbi:MAG: hypothetical protein HC785_02225 [Calothrix sp. CSU_2_0]|nr:hypothetical protein [Calothrix sp. CSU_2_0]